MDKILHIVSGINSVHPTLRHFLMRNNIPFKEITGTGKFLSMNGTRLVRTEDGTVQLQHNEGSLIPLPSHVAYYGNVLTTRADLMRRLRKDPECLDKAARMSAKNAAAAARKRKRQS
jgi:hypothetical protein